MEKGLETTDLTDIELQITAAYDAYSYYFFLFILLIAVWEIGSRIKSKSLSWRYVMDSISSVATLPAIAGMSYAMTLIGVGSAFSLAYVIHENYAIYQLEVELVDRGPRSTYCRPLVLLGTPGVSSY